jgi:hypothetical protein
MKISSLKAEFFVVKVQILYFFTVTSSLKRQRYLSFVINYCKGHDRDGFIDTKKYN